MNTILDFIINILHILNFILGFLGIVLFAFGYKSIRYVYTIITLAVGYALGFFIGVAVDSSLISVIMGIAISITLAFFNFVYYKYLRGFCIALLTLILSLYVFASLDILGLNAVLVISIVITIAVAVLSYYYEYWTKIVITSWLGAVFVLHNIIGAFVNINFGWISVLLSTLLAIGGGVLQNWLISRYKSKVLNNKEE